MPVHALSRPVCRTPDYLAPYREMLGRSGACFDTLLWTSRQTQGVRFRVITEMVDLHGRRVLDAGCGYGDLARHLAESGVAYARYEGIDALEEHVVAARMARLPRAAFRVMDFVADRRAFERAGPADVIVFSGSLNTLEEERALAVLERAWAACSEALVFNFLCERAARGGRAVARNGGVRRFDAMAMLEWAMSRTPLVAFRRDYLDGQDGTMAMRVR